MQSGRVRRRGGWTRPALSGQLRDFYSGIRRRSNSVAEHQVSKGTKLGIQVLVTVVVLAWLLRVVPLNDILRIVRSADPRFVALGLLLQLASRAPTAVRMKVIADAQGLPLNFARILLTLFSTSFYGLLLPGSLAGGAATWMKYVQHGAGGAAALVSIVVNRAAGFITVVASGIGFWVADRLLSAEQAVLFGCVVLVFLLSLFLLLFGQSHYLSRLFQRGADVPRLKGSTLFRKATTVAAHLALMREIPRKAVAGILVASLIHDLVAITALYFLALALGLDLGFLTVAWMRSAVQLVVMLPVSVAGLGVREGTLVLVTGSYGVAASGAIAWSLLIFAGTVLAAFCGGLIEAQALWTVGKVPTKRGDQGSAP
jgi:glycosyltransferase 2 family protein